MDSHSQLWIYHKAASTGQSREDYFPFLMVWCSLSRKPSKHPCLWDYQEGPHFNCEHGISVIGCERNAKYHFAYIPIFPLNWNLMYTCIYGSDIWHHQIVEFVWTAYGSVLQPHICRICSHRREPHDTVMLKPQFLNLLHSHHVSQRPACQCTAP